ncbi:MAG TPA: DUF4389 domain-containing protein [Blastococcus sp.]|nr:DUF4389 domain-containing protein [Blastococcus sp.]
MTEIRPVYPVRVDAAPAPEAVSRGLWLVKWLLLIPHFIVLAFLWIAFAVLSVIAFFAILFTARYPRALFEFNLGVLRWSWRVNYYGYGTLGTDRYPPFTLADVPDYPARLDVPYPERLSRGLVLVKWWLLAIPHYIVLAVFVGGGVWLGTRSGQHNSGWDSGWGAGGLVGLLVLIAAIVLLFTGRYPRSLYDFVLGMDRWALRVAAYVALMTDRYPPFRLDMGGTDPGSLPLGPPPVAPSGTVGATYAEAGSPPAGATYPAAGAGYPPPAAPPQGPAGRGSVAQGPVGQGRRPGWTGGRIVAVVIGSVLLFVATGALLAGGGLLWADRTQRDGQYLWTPTSQVSTTSYALASDSLRLDTGGSPWVLDRILGTARLRATPVGAQTDVFIGVARTADATAYLRGVGYRQLTDLGPGWTGNSATWTGTDHAGGAPSVPPGRAGIWEASVSGPGTQTLQWRPAEGNWTLVVMQADGGKGVAVRAQAGATVPSLPWFAGGLLLVGVVLLAIGALLVALAVHRARPPSAEGAVPGTPTGPGGPGTPAPVLTGGPAR